MSNIYHNSRKSSERELPSRDHLIQGRLYLVPAAVELLEDLERRIDPQAVAQVIATQLQETVTVEAAPPVAAIVPVEEPNPADQARIASAQQQVREAIDDFAA